MMRSDSASAGRQKKTSKPTGAWRRWEIWLFVSLMIYSLIPVLGGLLRAVELFGGPSIVPANPRALESPFPLVAHAVSSALFCVGGVLQFLPSVRRRSPARHRWVGYVVLPCGVVSAATGLWMTHYYSFPAALQGELLYGTRLVLAPTMIFLLAWAFHAAVNRRFARHASAMIRAYAIGQGASTQTFLGICWAVFVGTELEGLARDYVMVAAWVLNALLAEAIIARYVSQRPSARPHADPGWQMR